MTQEELAALLHETAERHHDAYAVTDGFDPDWPQWYASYLRGRLEELRSAPPDAEVAALLVESDRAFRDTGRPFEDWPAFYAARMLPVLQLR